MDRVICFVFLLICFIAIIVLEFIDSMPAKTIPKDKNGKPLIRHCRNCKWYGYNGLYTCHVTYKNIPYYNYEKQAKRCKYYESKERDDK